MLTEPERNIEVITYSELDFGDDFDFEKSYFSEWENWRDSMKNGVRDPEKIYVILQHDVDDSPERTHRLLRVQEDLGVRSNVMIFNRPVNRGKLAKDGIVEYVDYPLDLDLFLSLQKKDGFSAITVIVSNKQHSISRIQEEFSSKMLHNFAHRDSKLIFFVRMAALETRRGDQMYTLECQKRCARVFAGF